MYSFNLISKIPVSYLEVPEVLLNSNVSVAPPVASRLVSSMIAISPSKLVIVYWNLKRFSVLIRSTLATTAVNKFVLLRISLTTKGPSVMLITSIWNVPESITVAYASEVSPLTC